MTSPLYPTEKLQDAIGNLDFDLPYQETMDFRTDICAFFKKLSNKSFRNRMGTVAGRRCLAGYDLGNEYVKYDFGLSCKQYKCE